MPATKSPAFETAIEDSRKLAAKPTNDELLEVSLVAYIHIHAQRKERHRG